MSEWEAEISVLTAGKCSVKSSFRRKYAAVSPDLQVFLAAVTYCCHSAEKSVAEYSGVIHHFSRMRLKDQGNNQVIKTRLG